MPLTKAEEERARKEWQESLGNSGMSAGSISQLARMFGPKKRDEQ
jgi:hypothetical protein